MLIGCNQCKEVFHSASQCYWHQRNEHGMNHEEAFSETGELLEEARWLEEQKRESGSDGSWA
ncbi:MAG TPA: hypothetical protein VHQ47_05975 [Phycisphaerae bacterium]|jgi:hypothetical protein|nr:hypothetical protein [Phycisphaerae bacterium]